MYSHVDGCALTGFYDFFLHLLAHLGYHLLNSCWVNTAVRHKLMQSQTCNLTAHRVECRQHYGFRSVVNHDFHTGSSFKSTYVAALTAYDATLDFIIVYVKHRHCIFYGSLSGHTLYRFHYYALGLLIGGQFRIVHYVVDV